MLEPYGHAIYQQELPFPQGQNDISAPEMLVQSYLTILSLPKLLSFPPITNPIVQQELPLLEGLNQFLLPQFFSLLTTPVIQQELPFLQGQDPIFVPESLLPFPDKTLEFSEMQSQPDLFELPNGLSLFTPENGFVEFLNPAQAVVPEVAPQPQRQ
ncbi:hypothetical protein K3495_g3377 [Podosphaera aphanis]|nr:hypothetical protein K3495_g3377 [Podosphaera aphanis]